MIKAAGGTGKSTLFTKLHASCRSKGHLILIAASTTLAATVYENANTAHVSLILYKLYYNNRHRLNNFYFIMCSIYLNFQ
jgi:hypothetical protein